MSGDDDERHRPGVARLASQTPGADAEDPYSDVDVSRLPDWWARAVQEFRAHDLRPYRPPRFADGVLTHEVVDELEAAFDVDVSFGCVDADYRERWQVRVDGEVVRAVGRRRSPRGYTVYDVDSEVFRDLVRRAVDAGGG